MSLEAMTAVFDKSSSQGKPMLVMLVLANWADQHGFVVYRKKTERTLAAIAAKAHTTTRTVTETIAKMWEAGELWTEGGGRGPGDINEYRLCLPGLETDEEINEGVSFRTEWRPTRTVKSSPSQDVGSSAGTKMEPGPDVDGKLEVSSSYDQPSEKVEVSSDKLEDTAHKVEVSSRSIERPSSPITSPLTPQGEAGDARLPEKGQASPTSEDKQTIPSGAENDPPELQRLKALLCEREGEGRYRSWFADLRIDDVLQRCAADGPHTGRRETVILSVPGDAKRDMVEQRFFPNIKAAWHLANGPADIRLVARRPEPAPVYSIENPEPKKRSASGRRRRRA